MLSGYAFFWRYFYSLPQESRAKERLISRSKERSSELCHTSILEFRTDNMSTMAPPRRGNPGKGKGPRKRTRVRARSKKKDPLFVEGKRPRPMYVDYKDVDLLRKLINRHGRIVGRRKTGCSAVSQHAVTLAIKRARFMALLPYTGE
jgi:small subunit ribosomal protein S18